MNALTLKFAKLRQVGLLLAVTAAGLLLAGCANRAAVASTWHDADKASTGFDTVLVVALVRQGDKRRSFEEALADQLRGTANQIWTSNRRMAATAEITAASLAPVQAETGAAATIITRVTSFTVEPVEVQSYTDVISRRQQGSPITYDYFDKKLPAFMKTEFTTVLTTDVYRANSETSVYTLVSSATGQETLEDVIALLSTAIAKRVRADGVIR